MTNKNFGRFVRTALAVAMLTGAQFAAAAVTAGDYVKIDNSPNGNLGGGAFLTIEVNSNGSVLLGEKSFYTFCLEKFELFNPGETLKVVGVNNYTTNAARQYYTDDATNHPETEHTNIQDPLSLATEWLFTKFNVDTSFKNTVLTSNNSANSFQRAIWFLEGELNNSSDLAAYNSDTTAKLWVSDAVANAANWVDQGNQVRVLNLMKKDSYGKYSQHSQDQLYFVSAIPEPETYAMMLAGLGLMGTIARRRKNKTA